MGDRVTASDLFRHIGHSTHLVVIDGIRVLTDPWVSEPADRVLRHSVAPEPLPDAINLVLVSHEHEDHFDLAALRQIARSAKPGQGTTVASGATVIVPRQAMADALRDFGFARVIVPRDDGPIAFGPLTLRCPAGKHLVPEIVFHVSGSRGAFFFGGDTELTPALERFAASHPAEFALLPAERSTFFGKRSVMPPEDARRLADRLGARRCVLTHHESHVSRLDPRGWPFSWLVRIDVATQAELDDRFVIPTPGLELPLFEEPRVEESSSTSTARTRGTLAADAAPTRIAR